MLPDVVLVILLNMRSNSSQSFIIETFSFSEIYSVLYNRVIQYLVSLHSLKAMYIFDRKSFLEIPHSASLIFAPTLVPLRNICFDITYSAFFSTRYLYNPTIRTAKSSLFVFIALSSFLISNS